MTANVYLYGYIVYILLYFVDSHVHSKKRTHVIRFTMLPVKCPTFYYMLPWTRNICKRLYDNVCYWKTRWCALYETFHVKRFPAKHVDDMLHWKTLHMKRFIKRFIWNVLK